MVYTCFLCKWRSDKHPQRSYHKFPSNDELKQKWLDILGKSKVSVGTRTTLCSLHFEEDCFRYGLVNGRKILKDGSLPTLHLTKGGSEDETENKLMHDNDSIAPPPEETVPIAIKTETYQSAPALTLILEPLKRKHSPEPSTQNQSTLPYSKRLKDGENYKMTREDAEILGKSMGLQLRDLNRNQLTITLKIISDAIYYAKLGLLTQCSSVSLGPSDDQAIKQEDLQPSIPFQGYEVPLNSPDSSPSSTSHFIKHEISSPCPSPSL